MAVHPLPEIALQEEAQLVEKARQGDSLAFGSLVEPWRKPLFGYIYRMVMLRQDAEDLLQDVLLRVHAAGVDRGVWHLMAGLPYPVRLAGYGIRAPKTRVRGREVAGRVEATGSAVTALRVGDEVFGIADGSFAQYASARPDKLAPKPANLTFTQAAAAPVSALTALQAVRDRGHDVRDDVHETAERVWSVKNRRGSAYDIHLRDAERFERCRVRGIVCGDVPHAEPVLDDQHFVVRQAAEYRS